MQACAFVVRGYIGQVMCRFESKFFENFHEWSESGSAAPRGVAYYLAHTTERADSSTVCLADLSIHCLWHIMPGYQDEPQFGAALSA